jgi:hypothetical protein
MDNEKRPDAQTVDAAAEDLELKPEAAAQVKGGGGKGWIPTQPQGGKGW